jgi:hypothetical protein
MMGPGFRNIRAGGMSSDCGNWRHLVVPCGVPNGAGNAPRCYFGGINLSNVNHCA